MEYASSRQNVLSIFSLVMITTLSVDTLRNLPTTALFGSTLIFFSLLAAFFFLIPVSLVSAELASAWPEQGGIYVWVKRALGNQTAMFAIWVQLLANIIWYPSILSFVGASLLYLFAPHLAENKLFLVFIILVAFWGMTFINLFGMRSSVRFSNFCALTGLFIPMTFIIFLGASWTFSGHPLQIHLTPSNLLPNLSSPHMWVALTGVMMSFCGMEIATVHARDVRNPQRSFPIALALSAVLILITLICSSLSIAIVVPKEHISLVAGVMQTFNIFVSAYHIQWTLPIIEIMLVLGGLGSVSNWIIAPAKSLVVAANDGNLPQIFKHENHHGAPDALLILQAIVVSILTGMFLLLPSISSAYWVLGVLGAQIYMLMYMLMFISGIMLRYKFPAQERPFHIPGKNTGMWIIAGIGFSGSVFTFALGFLPPKILNFGSVYRYETLLIFSMILLILPSFVLPALINSRSETPPMEGTLSRL